MNYIVYHKLELMNFADKKIELWAIIYDQDTDRIYMFTRFARVLASVDSSIRGYLCDDPICDDVCSKIIITIKELKDQCVIPIMVDQLHIGIYKWELDKTSKIHQLLAKCHEHVPDELQSEIAGMFRDII